MIGRLLELVIDQNVEMYDWKIPGIGKWIHPISREHGCPELLLTSVSKKKRKLGTATINQQEFWASFMMPFLKCSAWKIP